MNFLNKDIGRALSVKLAQADQVQIASAYFSPSDSMLVSLNGISHLSMVISEEFTVNDPYKLASLNLTLIRSVPTDDAKGKLHAKVFIAKLRDGSTWVLLGSANLTQQGLFANQEACVEMHSTNPEDRAAIARIETWFDDLFECARSIDIASAREIFDQRSRYRLEPRPSTPPPTPIEYWAIKTTSGGADAEEHWPQFLKEGVLAIGWEELAVDPTQVNDADLRTALRAFLPAEKPGSVDFAVDIFSKFINMPIGSILVICRGLTPNQQKPVHIYGFARVTGPFRADPQNGTQWRFKRDAVIQEVGTSLPVEDFATAVDKDSFRLTMHELDKQSMERLSIAVGVPLEV